MPGPPPPTSRDTDDGAKHWPAQLVGVRPRAARRERVTIQQAGDGISSSPAESHSWRDLDDGAPEAALFFGMPAEF